MFRDHDGDRDHGTLPRSGHVQVSVITPWLMITEHHSRAQHPGPGLPAPRAPTAWPARILAPGAAMPHP